MILTSSPGLPDGPGGPRGPNGPCREKTERVSPDPPMPAEDSVAEGEARLWDTSTACSLHEPLRVSHFYTHGQ